MFFLRLDEMYQKPKYRKFDLRGDGYEITSERIPGERIRRIGTVNIDHTVFKKSTEEKLLLKTLKAKDKKGRNETR